MARDRARADDDALEEVDVRAEGVGDGGLDRVGVRDAHDRAAGVGAAELVERRHIRVCISVKLSPPGNRNVDGARCTVRHSGSFISFFSSAPVQSPKSHSSRPRSICDPQTRAPWRSARRSPWPARAVSCRRRRPASARRCARRRVGLGLPSSARCSPGARPGSTLPVVGVCPWRTQEHGGRGRVRRLRMRMTAARCCVSWWPWGGSNLLSGFVSRTRTARSRRRRVPGLPAAGRVA